MDTVLPMLVNTATVHRLDLFKTPGVRVVRKDEPRVEVPNDLAYAHGILPLTVINYSIKAKVPFWDKLRSAQQADVLRAQATGQLIVGHPCSGGKTAGAIAAALAAHPTGAPTVLVCGPALARGVWQSELAKWLPSARLLVLRGKKVPLDFEATLRIEATRRPLFVFVNYEVLSDWASALGRLFWHTVILDEMHELRGRWSDRVAKGIRRVFLMQRPLLRLGLTATPIWSKVSGIWPLLDLIAPGAFGTQAQFLKHYHGTTYDEITLRPTIGPLTNVDELHKRLEYLIRREPVAEIPPVARVPILVENAPAAKRMATASAALFAAAGPAGADPRQVHQTMMAAMQRETKAKLPALLAWIEARQDKRVLVATQTRAAVLLVDYLSRNGRKALAGVAYTLLEGGGGPTTYFFDGADPIEHRLALIASALTKPPPVVVVCTMASVRQSVDASALDAGVVLELPWTVEEAIQFEGRLARTTRAAMSEVEMAYIVLDDSFDRHCLDLLTTKLEDRRAVLGSEASDENLHGLLKNAGHDAILDSMLRKVGL